MVSAASRDRPNRPHQDPDKMLRTIYVENVDTLISESVGIFLDLKPIPFDSAELGSGVTMAVQLR